MWGSEVRRAKRAGDVPTLVRVLFECPEERRAATKALKGLDLGPWRQSTVRALLAAARDDDRHTRSWAIDVLDLLHVDEAADLFLDALDDSYVSVTFFAVFAVERRKDRRAIPRLLELLRHPDPLLRRVVAWALSEIGNHADHDVRGQLADVAEHDPIRTVRGAAKWSSRVLSDPRPNHSRDRTTIV
jgi:HEAT repeat protein